MPSSNVSTDTPSQPVPSLDHEVTQWMSTVIDSLGSAWNSSQLQRRGPATAPAVADSHPPTRGGRGGAGRCAAGVGAPFTPPRRRRRGSSPEPVIANSHSSSGTSGVGPAESTGNPSVRYCPGGSSTPAGASGGGRRKPRGNGGMSGVSALSAGGA